MVLDHKVKICYNFTMTTLKEKKLVSDYLATAPDAEIDAAHRAWMNRQIQKALDRKRSGNATYKTLEETPSQIRVLMHVRFQDSAEADLDAIKQHIEPESPKGLERVLTAIFTVAEQLESFPLLGREGDVREPAK